MLHSLAKPVALSDAEKLKGLPCSNPNEEQLQSTILLCADQKVMLCANLWVETGLVNGTCGQVKKIIYNVGEKPPQLSLFVIVDFPNYIGPPWDHNNPQNIPILPISRGIHRQIDTCKNGMGPNNKQVARTDTTQGDNRHWKNRPARDTFTTI